jgi:hypothetical protein
MKNKEKAISWAAKLLQLLAGDETKCNKNGNWEKGVIKGLAIKAREMFDVDEKDTLKIDTI